MLRLIILSAVVLIVGCGAPEGTDFGQHLFQDEDGIVRIKKGNSLFTGQAYTLVCEECAEPLFMNWPVHFVGQYKAGKPDGVFWVPKSGNQDDFFQYRDREEQTQVIYEDGKVIDGDA